MGTNYYWKNPSPSWTECEECGRIHLQKEELHIGKNSWGWLFDLQIFPELGINELKDWLPLLRTGEIRDEYGEVLSCKEMIKIILKKDWIPDLSKEAEENRQEALKNMNAPYIKSAWVDPNSDSYLTVLEEDSKLFRVVRNEKGKYGNYCLVKGWFS